MSTKRGGGGRDHVYKKLGVCAHWWCKLDACINCFGIVCPLLVSCFGSRGLSLAAFGIRRVAGCHKWSALVAVWSFRVERSGGCRCAVVEGVPFPSCSLQLLFLHL